MLASIRVYSDGRSYPLCELDLMKFTEEQVRERMAERGIEDDAFFVCGFSDWGIDTQFSLSEAYGIKRCITEIYDGDAFLVVHQLRQRKPLVHIFSHYYQFVSKDELEVMQYVLRYVDVAEVIEYFMKANTWVNAVNNYIEQGFLLNTERGFYVDVAVL
ncbi:hypothetical protein AB3329_01870 [Streptococcus sp. H31]|uniref:hypothetical protein n=1 Tax=Streptococcus huangxiaojuni TaxID=3237239 RepID=UPI0034A54490